MLRDGKQEPWGLGQVASDQTTVTSGSISTSATKGKFSTSFINSAVGTLPSQGCPAG